MPEMMKSTIVIWAALFATAAFAQEQAPAAQDATEVADTSNATEILCRREPAPTGSRIGPRRICKTRAEWDVIGRENRDVIERVQRTTLTGN